MLTKLIGGIIAVAIFAILINLYKNWKSKVLTKERKIYLLTNRN